MKCRCGGSGFGPGDRRCPLSSGQQTDHHRGYHKDDAINQIAFHSGSIVIKRRMDINAWQDVWLYKLPLLLGAQLSVYY